MKKILFYLTMAFVILTNATSVLAQTGTTFWFAAPDVSLQHHQNGKPLNLHITAQHATTVTISRPADPSFTPFSFPLAEQETEVIRLDTDARCDLDISEIEVYARALSHAGFLQKKGFLIESYPGDITAYYELDSDYNRDIASLKSNNGLGRDFWVSTQNAFKNHGYTDDFSGFTVLATEKDTTTVRIYNETGVLLENFGSGYYHEIKVPYGEAFSIRAAGQAPGTHLQGLHVTSDKDIVIMLYDDSMQMADGGSWDIFMDQLVPTSLVGLEYVVLKGNITIAAPSGDTESIFFTATQNNTQIYIDGVYEATLAQKGDYHMVRIYNDATHVRCTKPTYVNHITGYGNSPSRELGGAVLPTIDGCTGSHTVTVKRSEDPASYGFFMNLMVRNDTIDGSPNKNQAIENFTYSVNNGPPQTIPASHFTYIMDSAFAYYDKDKAAGSAFYQSPRVVDGDIVRVDNPISRFHLGIMQGNRTGGCKYGYFSDYAASLFNAGIGGATSDKWNVYCNTDPIRLVASGGQTYDWYGTFDPTLVSKLSATDIADPFFYPDTTGSFQFSVDVSGECWVDTTLQLEVHIINSPVASFTLNSQEACSPFDPIITNNTNTIFADTEKWQIKLGGSSYTLDQDTLPRTFTLDLPDNNTDTVQVFQVTLKALGIGNSCPTEKSKYISVLPQVNAKFSVLDTMGCHPFEIDIVDSSWGHINDTTSYQWFFGDGKTSDDTVPTKSYLNYIDKDTVYDLQLVLTSPLGCTDTAHQDIYVYPFINSSLSIDNSVGCSPLNSVLKSNSSIGVDTFYYHIDYFYGDTTFKKTNTDEFNWFHVDTNYASDPDTLLVTMYGVNRFGCIDTLNNIPREIVVFPEVKSSLNIDTNAICDLGSITATNHSVGVELLYKWSFGDGTEKYDSLPNSQIKTYFNRTNADTNFTISLVSTSKYYCRDTVDTMVTVHPYISADFSMEKESNCVPLDVKFNNLCVRGHQFTWDLGDGSPTTDTTVPSFNHMFWNPLTDRDTTYNIQLVARNNEGCSDTISKSLLLFPQVVADFEISDTFGCNPVDVDFTNTSTGKDLIFNWDFGNGITNSSSATNFTQSFQNLYQNDTTYILELTVVNAQGCDSIVYDSVTVLANIDVQFDLPNSDSCSPFIIHPRNRSSIGTKEFIWDFGPLGTSNDHTPVLTPFENNSSTTDTVEVTLIGYGANDAVHLACADTFTKHVYIYPDIIASFDLAVNESCQPYKSSIINNTTLKSGVNFRWMLDSLFYSSLENPKDLFIYNNTDSNETHIMQLFTETDKGCTHDTVDTITVYSHVKPYFTMDKSEICSGDSINFDRSLSFGDLTYVWDFDDGIIDTTNSETLIHSYVQTVDSVHKYVALTAINSAGCDSTVSHRVVVNPAMHASFEIEHDTSCEPYVSKIVNNSYPSGGTNYFWKLNGGFYATGENPDDLNIHNETENYADYTLTLEAGTQYNCIDDTSLSFTVLPVVEPDFTLDTRELCHGDSVGIDRTLTRIGGTKEFDWYFEENLSTTSDSAKMFRTYTNESDETKVLGITLTVSNGHSECDKTHRDSIQVHPKVDADFEFTNDEDCQPLSTEFKNFTNNQEITSFSWYLDNSIFSNQKVPNTLTIHNHTKYDSAHSVTMYAVSHNKTFNNASVKECRGDVTVDLMVYSNLVSSFTLTPKRLCSGDSIYVDPSYSKTGVQNNGYKYIWSIDGTEYNNLEEAQYISMENKQSIDPKDITVILTIEEEENNKVCRASMPDIVTVYPEVFADFEVDDSAFCYPHTSRFINYSNSVATEFIWDFDDGRTSTDEDPYHTYEYLNNVDDSRPFSVKLESKSQYNCVDSARRDIVVYAKPNAAFHLQKKADCPPFLDSIYNRSVGSNLSYEWTFNNIGTSTDETGVYTFYNGGTTNSYQPVRLEITSDRGCKDTTLAHVTVYPNVVSNFTVSNYEGCSPLNDTLSSESFNADSKLWYIDGEPFSTQDITTYQFKNTSESNDTIELVLYSKSNNECFDYDTQYVVVYPTPDASFSPARLVNNYDADIDATILPIENKTPYYYAWNYDWTFGDGNTGTQDDQLFEYTYGDRVWGDPDNDFKMLITMRAYNKDNPECNQLAEQEIILYPPLPQVEIGEDIIGCVPLTVDLTSTTKYVNPGGYEWDYGNLDTDSGDPNVTYTYDEPGTYTAKLIVYGDGGATWDFKIITVHPKPIIDFNFSNDSVVAGSQSNNPEEIDFYNHTKHATSYQWYFNTQVPYPLNEDMIVDHNDLDERYEDLKQFRNIGSNYDIWTVYYSEEKNPTFSYPKFTPTGVYYPVLYAKSEHGCESWDSSEVGVTVVAEGIMEFPNIFYVNPSIIVSEYVDDSKHGQIEQANMLFRPYSSGVIEYEMEVYNKWGVRVFRSNDVNKGWNGTIQGVIAKQDVYIWRVKGRYANGKAFKKAGDVTLLIGTDQQ